MSITPRMTHTCIWVAWCRHLRRVLVRVPGGHEGGLCQGLRQWRGRGLFRTALGLFATLRSPSFRCALCLVSTCGIIPIVPITAHRCHTCPVCLAASQEPYMCYLSSAHSCEGSITAVSARGGLKHKETLRLSKSAPLGTSGICIRIHELQALITIPGIKAICFYKGKGDFRKKLKDFLAFFSFSLPSSLLWEICHSIMWIYWIYNVGYRGNGFS